MLRCVFIAFTLNGNIQKISPKTNKEKNALKLITGAHRHEKLCYTFTGLSCKGKCNIEVLYLENPT